MLVMSGRFTRLALRAMDRAAKLVRQPPEQPPHLVTGRRGEEEAYFYLRRMGYVIVARNYRSRRRPSEIDLVGWDGEMLCFIEVKTRTTVRSSRPRRQWISKNSATCAGWPANICGGSPAARPIVLTS